MVPLIQVQPVHFSIDSSLDNIITLIPWLHHHHLYLYCVQDVVDTHPGLLFLKEATEFHSRYVHTVSGFIYHLPMKFTLYHHLPHFPQKVLNQHSEFFSGGHLVDHLSMSLVSSFQSRFTNYVYIVYLVWNATQLSVCLFLWSIQSCCRHIIWMLSSFRNWIKPLPFVLA